MNHSRYSGTGYGAQPEESDSGHKSPLWMIIYTDMITNLMIFFLLSYCLTWLSKEEREIAAQSFQKTYSSKQVETAKKETNIIVGLSEKKAEDTLKEKFTNIVQINEERIKITLPSPVLFDSGKANLKPAARHSLKEIANIIRNMSNRIVVEGHTDNKPLHGGQYRSNWELSTARAFSVIQYFMEKEHIDPKRLSALGYGEFRPKVPNDMERDRTINRRIEINIIKAK